jgi:hypothetical protein
VQRDDPYAIPHRKNAAEWIIYTCLLPIAVAMRLVERIKRRS